jgi:phenylacetate-coenzyme A ligase PaaK-like adenylate-forming protein
MVETLLGTMRGRQRDDLARAAGEPAAAFATRRDARLARLVRFHYENGRNPAYRGLLERHGITVSRLPERAADLPALPVVEKTLLREGDYAARPAVADAEVRFVVQSSGSTGSPTAVPHSAAFERRVFGELYIRLFEMMGRGDLLREPGYGVAHYTPRSRNTGTYAAFTLLRELVPSTIVACTRDPLADHLRVLLGDGVRWSASAPGFYLTVLAGAREHGLDLRRVALDTIVAGGAPVSEDTQRRLVDGYGLGAFRLGYVCSELGWMGFQTEERGPYSLFADDFIIEVVDQRGRQVAPGERGRVLVTALASDAAPLIRYAIGDTARYLGYTGPYAHFPVIDEIGRDMVAHIGDGKVTYDDLAGLPLAMAALGAPVTAFQLAKRRAADGRDQIHVRVELADPGQDIQHVTSAAVNALRRHPQMDDQIGDGEIPRPIVETFSPGQLSAGRLKVPLYVDETHVDETHVDETRIGAGVPASG